MKLSLLGQLACSTALLLPGLLVAQENEVQTEEQAAIVVSSVELSEDGESGQSFGQMRVISSDGSMPQALFMGDSGVGGANFGFSLGSAGPMDSFSLLQNPSVQKDLELVDEQVKQLRDIQREFGKRLKEQLAGGITPDKAKSLGEVIKKMEEEKREKINGILLEHQQERLKQVAFQQHLRSAGTAKALSHAKFAEELGLTKEQLERLKKRSKELKKEMEEKIKKMREDMKEELLDELKPSQRKKLEKMIGDKYEPNPNDWKEAMESRMKRVRQRRKNDGD